MEIARTQIHFLSDVFVAVVYNLSLPIWSILTTITKDLHSYLFYQVLVLPAQFFLTLSNSTFLRAESTNLQPHLASS